MEAEAASKEVLDLVDSKPSGGRPRGGIRAAVRELPLPGKTEDARRISAQRAVRLAAIAAEAKAAVQAAGLRGLAEGQKVSFDVENDRRSGKPAAINLQAS